MALHFKVTALKVKSMQILLLDLNQMEVLKFEKKARL
tara:strand:- start:1745 stop:1855 length:111 start_codon:yes stop_codon:yes gene_type:complete